MTQVQNSEISFEQKQRLAEQDIINNRSDFTWGFREWTIEIILDKFGESGDVNSDCELYIPDYQRDYKWTEKIASRFIESILLGFPIPYLYIASVEDIDDQDQDGRVEIIDGTQRVRALRYFVNNEFPLTDLKELKSLEGFYYKDLLPGRRRKFLRESLRFIELKSDDDGDYRRDFFERINSGLKPLVPMEVRKGSEEALSDFYRQVITPCSELALYKELAPLSFKQRANQDYAELVLRFFAYTDNLDGYKGRVAPFLDDYLKSKKENGSFNANDYIQRFNDTLLFVQKTFPYGFRKRSSSKTVSRTYFEAIAIGSYFALQQNPNLHVSPESVEQWLNSEDFIRVVTSDAANNASKLKGRINYVKDKLLLSS